MSASTSSRTGLPEAAAAQLHLDGDQEVVRLVLFEGEVGVAGDPEGVVVADGHAGEQRVQMGGDDLLERHEALAVGHDHETGQQPGGTLTRAMRSSPETGSCTSTTRLSERFEM